MTATRPIFAVLAFCPSVALAQDFPVTLEGERGTVTLIEPPERIVVVGVHEQDFLYALGIAPVGVHEWWGVKPFATWPWAEEARIAVGAEPEVLTGWEINAEWVAALDPDLIVATYFGDLTDEDFTILSQIAPVLTAPPGHPQWGAPWQEELRLLAAATGTSALAEAIVANLEADLAAARVTYPDLEGKTGATGYYHEGNVQTFNAADTAHRFLASLGIDIPDTYDELASERGGLDVSAEAFDLIDLDLFIFPDESPETSELFGLSVFQTLGLAREGRVVALGGGDLSAALSFQTPLAMGYLIETLPAMLSAAADGDPATPVPSAE